jgi:hypothetical protein
MKIALYLAGHLRTFNNDMISNIKETFNNIDYDLYVSTYNKTDRESKESVFLTNDEIKKKFDDLPLKNIIIEKDETKIKCLTCDNEAKYGPKNYICYKTGNMTERITSPVFCANCKKDDFVLTNGPSYWSQWRHVYNCYKMAMESGVEYEYHVRSRPDIIIVDKIDFENLENGKLYSGFGGTLGYPDDMFAVGKHGESWDHYCDINKVLLHSLHAHELTDYTFIKFPIQKHIQIAIVREPNFDSMPKVLLQPFGDNWLLMHKKESYNII